MSINSVYLLFSVFDTMILIAVLFVGVHASKDSKYLKDPVVTISDGRIQGVHSTSYDGNEYMEFVGIPYAEPPTGSLRFKDSVPVAPWNGTKIVNQTSICLQVRYAIQPVGGLTIGNEDCLHINVFVPGCTIDRRAKLDVIVFIHGGGFMFGSAIIAQPKFLMDRKVILVSFNYRVGVLGFLSTGDKYLPGNFGMKDQVLALKWVRKNIKYFGGNKNSVTLNGHSAGGASVHYHYLSPLSRGLFQRGISTSGCALNTWTFIENPLELAMIIAESLNCPTENTEDLVNCLIVQPARSLADSIRGLRYWLYNPFSPLGLVVDDSSSNPFLPIHPYEILISKDVYDVPWISTSVTNEGTYPGAGFWQNKEDLVDLNNNWNLYAPDVLHYRDVVNATNLDEVSLEIKKFYLPTGIVNEEFFPDLLRMISDRLYLSDIGLCLELHSEAVQSEVHSYVFDYLAEKRISLYFRNISDTKLGVGHGDDTLLIYSMPPLDMSRNDEKVKDYLVNLITAYAIHGHPIINFWTPICKNECNYIDYLYIGRNREVKMKRADNFGERIFWQSLPIMENGKLFPNIS